MSYRKSQSGEIENSPGRATAVEIAAAAEKMATKGVPKKSVAELTIELAANQARLEKAKHEGKKFNAYEKAIAENKKQIKNALLNEQDQDGNALGQSEAQAKAPPSGRKSPSGDEQADFYVPSHDVGRRDNRTIMDVAVFRLSKKFMRANEIISYKLPNGDFIEVTSGHHGMATIWDYDIVMMMISHLTEAMNHYREGKGDKPGRTFRPRVSDILKFARRWEGSRQIEEVEAALDRLKGTTVKTVRERTGTNGLKTRLTEAEGLISSYSVLSTRASLSSRTKSGIKSNRVDAVEIEVPLRIYQEIVDGQQPDVLTVHQDYFLITSGIGRFVYRLARRAAGNGTAKWGFKTIYKRSGSKGTSKEFCRILREIVVANDLPEYALTEEEGQSGPQLVMALREP